MRMPEPFTVWSVTLQSPYRVDILSEGSSSRGHFRPKAAPETYTGKQVTGAQSKDELGLVGPRALANSKRTKAPKGLIAS